ncbi:hypothetical protein HMPREF1002_04739 [Porphyromonas sp. 31_2]|nr:hypothetical protein HMPREF1002_04739 [Porphyromonas sp. 31_2]
MCTNRDKAISFGRDGGDVCRFVFVYEPETWLLTNRCLKIFFCRFIVHILPILIK